MEIEIERDREVFCLKRPLVAKIVLHPGHMNEM
jgi:hypothetical protein